MESTKVCLNWVEYFRVAIVSGCNVTNMGFVLKSVQNIITTLYNLYVDPDELDQRTFSALDVFLIIMSLAFLVFEVIFYIRLSATRNIADFMELVYRIVMFLLTIILVFGFPNDCWCAPQWHWQIGALVLFMAFFNFILLLKRMPLCGVPINMLLNVITGFLRLVYLPILLILSFTFAFNMLFVSKVSISDGN